MVLLGLCCFVRAMEFLSFKNRSCFVRAVPFCMDYAIFQGLCHFVRVMPFCKGYAM